MRMMNWLGLGRSANDTTVALWWIQCYGPRIHILSLQMMKATVISDPKDGEIQALVVKRLSCAGDWPFHDIVVSLFVGRII